jgi:hypothetical protein
MRKKEELRNKKDKLSRLILNNFSSKLISMEKETSKRDLITLRRAVKLGKSKQMNF